MNEWKYKYLEMKGRYDELERLYNELMFGVIRPSEPAVEMPNPIGLKVIPGGKKLEEGPPFVN